VNARTVRFTLKHPWGPFLSDLSLFNTGIYPQAFFRKVGESGMGTQTDGSGPYNVSVWKKGQYLRLQKNPGYWNAGAYPMQYVEYRVIPNDNTRLLQTKAGQLDVDFEVPFNQIGALNGNGSASIRTDPSTRTLYIVPNHKVKPFADPNVRQAINHAIDRKGLIRAVLFGHGVPASSFMPKGALWWNPNVPVPTYDVDLAKSYMKKSKYPNGFSATMEVPSGNSQYQQIDVILKSELAPLGIKLNLKNMDPTTIFNNQDNGNYHMTNNQWTNDIPDPDELVSFAVDYSLGSKAFFTWYNNATLGRMSRAAENTNNSAKRKQIYYQIQAQFAKDVPFFPLFYVPFVNAVSSKVHGFSENPLGYFNIQGVTKSG
jgi:peptide/nickel transport system substrate-binding protein